MGRLYANKYKNTSVVFHLKIGRALTTKLCLTPFPILAYSLRFTDSSLLTPSNAKNLPPPYTVF